MKFEGEFNKMWERSKKVWVNEAYKGLNKMSHESLFRKKIFTTEITTDASSTLMNEKLILYLC